jgi:hypothetical protein
MRYFPAFYVFVKWPSHVLWGTLYTLQTEKNTPFMVIREILFSMAYCIAVVVVGVKIAIYAMLQMDKSQSFLLVI